MPGQNLTIANTSRPGDAAAAAGLAANGIFAPLVLTDKADLPRTLESYLLDIQPGFENGDPCQGVYNHVWILGGADALSAASQDARGRRRRARAGGPDAFPVAFRA